MQQFKFFKDVHTLYSNTYDFYIFQNFQYDGQGPGAYFYAGPSGRPSNDGYQIPNEKGSMEVLQRYTGQNLVLSLPSGKTLRNVKWISVWCEEFEVNFGEVTLPDRFKYPRPQKIDSFNGIHDVSNFIIKLEITHCAGTS